MVRATLTGDGIEKVQSGEIGLTAVRACFGDFSDRQRRGIGREDAFSTVASEGCPILTQCEDIPSFRVEVAEEVAFYFKGFNDGFDDEISLFDRLGPDSQHLYQVLDSARHDSRVGRGFDVGHDFLDETLHIVWLGLFAHSAQ